MQKDGLANALKHDMSTAQRLPQNIDEDLSPRRPASVEAIDARLSVWGQASRNAITRRAEALCEGAARFAELHGRNSVHISTVPVDPVRAMLNSQSKDDLGKLAATLLPDAVRCSCRILWVDADRLTENLLNALSVHLENARAEIRRIQALHRRRARLWRADVERLNALREDVESLRVPRGGPAVADATFEVLESLLLS